jgi:hypothetical protein
MKQVFFHLGDGHGHMVTRHDDWPWSYNWTADDVARVKEMFKAGMKAEEVQIEFLVSEVELAELCRAHGIMVRR